ncbi:RING-type domain-containing protein [Mycena kentingensis (nom. inval.)]|nr:RING-type domain-containing protein [Mycena kentingensis (nom. inval.)]
MTTYPRRVKREDAVESIVEELPDNLLETSPPPDGASSSRVASDKPHKSSPSPPAPAPAPTPQPDLLSTYTCPICYSPPTNATLTPCGHVACGSCLFTAVHSSMERNAHTPEGPRALCPLCKAVIPWWDGRGGGVVGLRTAFVLNVQ